MNIILKPDAVNFSGNLKRFKISTTFSISFILKQGSRTLFEASYTPGSNQMVEIDVKDIIEADLNVQFRNLSYPYEQPDMAKTYTAYVDEQSVEFTVVKGGVDNLATTDINFMQFNWLTWQPKIKKVTYYLPEMLTFFSAVESVVKVKAYFKEDNGSYSEETKQLLSIIAGKAYTIPVQYAVIAGKFDSRMPAFYDVWFENMEGVHLSYIQRYVASGAMSEDEQWIIFENSLGGFDTFRAYGTNTLSANHDHQLAEINEEINEYHVDTSREFTKNTGYLSGYERKWMLDFFPSKQKYLYDGNSLRKIIVTEDSTSYVSNQLPTSYEFTYKYADAKPYLNLQRPAELPNDLEIQVPDLGSFTIPPRLVEFPSQNLTEGVLFPVQNPYSEKWATTTIEDILNYVLKNIIELGQDDSGGIGHTHPNLKLLNALEWFGGYLIAYDQKIKAGYTDIANDLTDSARDLFLKRYKDDYTNYLIKFLAGGEFGDFIDSMIAGKGAGIFPDGRGQFSRLEVRDALVVIRMIINEIQAMAGDFTFSDAGCIEKVEDMGEGTYKLWMEKRTEYDVTSFNENDVMYSIINNLLTGGTDYYTSWFRCLTKNVNDNTLTVVLYPDGEVPGEKNYPPVAGYNVTRRGNAVLPDIGEVNERAQSWLLSSREGRIMFLQNVYKPKLEDYNYALTIGKLPNLKALEQLPVTTDDVGIVSQTVIAEKFYQFDYNGDVVPNKVDRGEWSLQVAQSGAPYRFIQHELTKPSGSEYALLEQHTVYHLGCKWGCIVDRTQLEPGWNSPAWVLLEGDGRYSLQLSLSGGEAFVIGGVDTDIHGRVLYGAIDITSEVMSMEGTEVEWFRNSGNIPADNLWTPEYVDGDLLAIHIDNSNQHGVGSDFGFVSKSVQFICRVFIPVSGDIQKIEQKFGFDIL